MHEVLGSSPNETTKNYRQRFLKNPCRFFIIKNIIGGQNIGVLPSNFYLGV